MKLPVLGLETENNIEWEISPRVESSGGILAGAIELLDPEFDRTEPLEDYLRRRHAHLIDPEIHRLH